MIRVGVKSSGGKPRAAHPEFPNIDMGDYTLQPGYTEPGKLSFVRTKLHYVKIHKKRRTWQSKIKLCGFIARTVQFPQKEDFINDTEFDRFYEGRNDPGKVFMVKKL